MKKASVIVILFFVTIGMSFVSAQPADGDSIVLAYQCLQDQIDRKDESALSLQEAVFATLALGSDGKLQSVIADFKASGEDCYGPGSTCTILDTAQVTLAKDRINSDSDDNEAWLLDRREVASDLEWFMLVDITNHQEAECDITYNGATHEVVVKADLKFSGNPGNCFTIAQGGFWLQVSQSCFEESFEISCSEDFVTTLLYRKENSNPVFVSPNTHSAVALGTTEETVNSSCFGINGVCDYEGSLWAALALQSTGNDVNSYLPYLLALSDDNDRLFPDTFLYIMTQGQEQFTSITQALKQNKYWEAPSTKYNRFYDSALGMLALQGTLATELGLAESYFQQIQTSDGCWNNNNIRDTAFLLYSGWQRSDIPRNGGAAFEDCEAQGFFCGGQFECVELGGSTALLNSYVCANNILHCCSVALLPPSCSIDLQGDVCLTGTQRCTGDTLPSAEGTCCLPPGECETVLTQTSCELAGGDCKTSCGSNDQQTSDSCGLSSGLTCCMFVEDSGFGLGLWSVVIILAILIIIIVFAIINRKKVQLWWFRFRANRRSKRSKPYIRTQSPRRGFRPGMRPPPGMAPGRMPPPRGQGRRPMPPPRRQQPPRKGTPGKGSDQELDETLKKLKEMSE